MSTLNDPTLKVLPYESIFYQEFTGSLFDDDIHYRDIAQGQLGDCYLMAALAEIAQHGESLIPGLITENNDSYTINIGILESFDISKKLPVYGLGDGSTKPIYANYDQSEGWVALLEKGYAIASSLTQLNSDPKNTPGENSYVTIEGGWPERAVVDLVGGTAHSFQISELSDQEIYDILSNNTRPTFLSTIGDAKKDKNVAGTTGLAGNHAYSVLGYNEDGTYRLFNPWNGDGQTEDGIHRRYANVTIEQIRQAGEYISWVDLPENGGLSLVTTPITTLKAPTDILIYDLPLEFRLQDGLSINQIWASDPNGWEDLSSVEFWLEDESGLRFDLTTISDFSPYTDNPIWAGLEDLFFDQSTLNNLSIAEGVYTFNAQSTDQTGLSGTLFTQPIEIVDNLSPTSLLIDNLPTLITDNENLVVDQVWAQDPDGWQDIASIDYWLIDPNDNLIELRDSTEFYPWEEDNLWAGTDALSFTPEEYAVAGAGIYTFYAQVFDSQGQTIEGAETIFEQEIQVLPSNTAPNDLLIYGLPTSISADENLVIDQIWAYDADGWQDIASIDYRLIDPNGNLIELRDSTEFYPWEEDNLWAGTDALSFTPEEYAVAGAGIYTFYAQVFDSQGTGSAILEQEITVNKPLVETEEFLTNFSQYMKNIRDFDGNDLGAHDSWKQIGSTDVQGDGDTEYVFVNPEIGRWATVGADIDGLIDFSNHGQDGDTRIVGIYIDPQITAGIVEAGSPFDSQQRFQNDLYIDNLTLIENSYGDYDGDSLQEIYFKVNDGSAVLHAYMHADGNIQYANYQSESDLQQFMTDNGVDESVWSDWF